jgi:hypothetical protein
MGKPRFISIHATPPGGMYEYAIGDDVVRDRSRFRIAELAGKLREKHGLPASHDPFIFVMEYMCPRLPDGACTQPTSIHTIKASVVKANSLPLMKMPCATSDVIEQRICTCVSCPMHRTKGFCMDCTGILDWIYKEFGPRRPQLPVDHATGVCECDLVLAAVSASVADLPPVAGVEYPAGCWRTAKEA